MAVPEILYLAFRSNTVQTVMVRWFMAQIGETFNTKIKVGGVNISFFDHLILERILVEDQSQDTLIFIDELRLQIDSFSLIDKKLNLKSIILQKPHFNLFKSETGYNFKFILDSLKTIKPPTSNQKVWNVNFDNFYVKDAGIRYKDIPGDTLIHPGINFRDIELTRLNISLSDFSKKEEGTLFMIKDGSLEEKSGFSIRDLKFIVLFGRDSIKLKDLRVLTLRSEIIMDSLLLNPVKISHPISDSLVEPIIQTIPPLLHHYLLQGNLGESKLGLDDLAYFFPDIWGMDEIIRFSGKMRGTLDNIKFKNFNFHIGLKTVFNADLELRGLPNWQNTFIFFKFYNNTFNFNDFATLRLPDTFSRRYPSIHESLLDNINLTYHGTFSGFPSDFVAYGTLNGDLGSLKTDLAITPTRSGTVNFKGSLDARSFLAGKLLNFNPLGKVSLHTDVSGYKKGNKFDATINGSIDSLEYNQTRIDSIYLNGRAQNQSYDGELTVNDRNLKMKFTGKADFGSEVPLFNFTSSVKTANLYTLGFDKQHRDSKCSFDLVADFTGKNIDDLNGNINMQGIKLSREGQYFNVNSLDLKTINTPDKNIITCRSDIADFDITGKYRLLEIDLTLRDYLRFYLPSANIPLSDRRVSGVNKFDFDLRVKKPKLITYYFIPQMEAHSPLYFKGDINSEERSLNFDCTIESLSYKNYQSKGLHFTSRNVRNQWLLRLGSEEIGIGKSFRIENLTFNNILANDSLITSLTWENAGQPTYSGKIDIMGIFSKDKDELRMADITIKPSNIWVADTLWQIDESQVHVDSTLIAVKHFNIRHRDEYLSIAGKLTDNSSDRIKINMNALNLGFIDLVSKSKTGIEGVLNGTTEIADINNSFLLNSNMEILGFRYAKDQFGDVQLDNIWNKEEQRLYSLIQLRKEKTKPLVIKGYYVPRTDSIQFDAVMTNFSLETIFPFLRSFANKVGGTGNGNVSVTGTLSDPNFQGKIDVTNGLIGIDYTKVDYHLNQPIYFSDDSLMFKNIKLTDDENNTAFFNGYITHKMFNHLKYNMHATTKNIKALRTTLADNSIFYGNAHCSGNVAITGAGDLVKLDLTLQSEKGTEIFIPMETPASASVNDFIRFVKTDTLLNKKKMIYSSPQSSGFEMNMTLNATPEAKVQILFSSTLGDIISGYGSGNLSMFYDQSGNFSIFGNYTIDRGDYLFTLQNVIGKRFKLEEGGLISWNGDPYDAIIDLNAIYKLRASVHDLLLDTYNGDNTTRIPVECKINLSRKLLNPTLKFDIFFPTADERTKDELQQFISSQDDINRQMLALLLMGQFYTPEYLRGKQDAQSNTGNLVGVTTSEMLSNQLSNWLSQISNNFDIGFNYRPGDQVNTNQMELALSTQIFNDRVTINGNIGNNSSTSASATNTVIGEIEVFVKLNKSGKLQLKAYNRANDDLIYDVAPYKQGVGLSFRESFDSFGDLFRSKQSRENKRRIKNTDSTSEKQ